MAHELTRRDLVRLVPFACGAALVGGRRARAGTDAVGPTPPGRFSHYPQTDPEIVRAVVGAAHAKLDELKSFVEDRPTLALAAVDWGFGDWETALGAASHMGRRDIAEYLMSHGARPDVFTFSMLGNVDAVRAMIEGSAGLQRTRGPHGITLLAHARAGGEQSRAVVEYLESLGDADPKYVDEPLSEEQKAPLRGMFPYGDMPLDEVFIIGDGMGGLTIKRGEKGTPRRLFHQGGLRFHPAGAPNVRVEFTAPDEMNGPMLRVTDGIFDVKARGGC